MRVGDRGELAKLINRNFDLRYEVCSSISEKNKQMVQLARSVGASAKFTGSGGGIIGTYEDEEMLRKLKDKLKQCKIETIIPVIVKGGPSKSYESACPAVPSHSS